MGSPLVRLGRAAYRFVRNWLVGCFGGWNLDFRKGCKGVHGIALDEVV